LNRVGPPEPLRFFPSRTSIVVFPSETLKIKPKK
jgi:hypothetical protein